ncbi:SDR family NAD(P)-dependent oxidoreductase [Micromonospora sp. B11E3]|uniref:SDR family NAD(P)-dependent oxidoreductase n=1 Tax=Micromonospora sp. B11E3 TaxID=3153562 RepID=UPI00325F6DE1
MAETCTAISYQPFGPDAVQHAELRDGATRVRLHPAAAPGTTTFLSMGPPAPGARFRIAAPDGTTALPERHVGRLQVRSDRVTPGYLHNDEANRAAFPDGDWFDTGDLAFLADGRVTITGRGKEVIIVNGVHYFCHEIEDVVGGVDGVAPSFVAAVGAPGPDGTERMVVLFVADGPVDAELLARIRRRLPERLQISGAQLVPVERDRFEKTTSGKIQRTSMRGRLLAGGYEAALRRVELLDAAPGTYPDCLYRPAWSPRLLPREPVDGPDTRGRRPYGARRGAAAGRPRLDAGRRGRRAAGRRRGRGGTGRRRRAAGRERGRTGRGRGHRRAGRRGAVDDAAAAEEAARICGPGLLGLQRALAEAGWTGTLITLSRGLHRIRGDEAGCYPAALAAALGETFGVERPQVRAWHLDLPGDDVSDDAETVVAAAGWSHGEPVVAWRGRPLVRVLERAEPVAGPPALPCGSRWLVTGGLGGIGRLVLGDLAAAFDLRLLVVGRTAARDLAGALAEIADGGRMRYARADVTDDTALEDAVAAAERAWGAPLDGVLHLAGEYELCPLAELDADRWRAGTAAKVDGSLRLARLLLRRPGSRFVAFSSLLSLIPLVGTGAYAAANRFLEALCEHLDPQVSITCLTWTGWRGVGMNAETAATGARSAPATWWAGAPTGTWSSCTATTRRCRSGASGWSPGRPSTTCDGSTGSGTPPYAPGATSATSRTSPRTWCRRATTSTPTRCCGPWPDAFRPTWCPRCARSCRRCRCSPAASWTARRCRSRTGPPAPATARPRLRGPRSSAGCTTSGARSWAGTGSASRPRSSSSAARP